MRRTLATVSIVIWSSLLLWPQAQPTTAKPTKNSVHAKDQGATGKKPSGSISGRVFAITRAGDLKPARFARVYLMGNLPSPPGSEFSAVSVFPSRHTLVGLTHLINQGRSSVTQKN